MRAVNLTHYFNTHWLLMHIIMIYKTKTMHWSLKCLYSDCIVCRSNTVWIISIWKHLSKYKNESFTIRCIGFDAQVFVSFWSGSQVERSLSTDSDRLAFQRSRFIEGFFTNRPRANANYSHQVAFFSKHRLLGVALNCGLLTNDFL